MTIYMRLLAIPLMYLMAYLFSQPFEWWMGPIVVLSAFYIFCVAIGQTPWDKP